MTGEDPVGAAQPGAAAPPGRRVEPAAAARLPAPGPRSAGDLVDCLFRAHALTLVSTAMLLVGDQDSAEDVVQEAFLGLYRSVPRLRDPDKALPYLRASVLNGCRSAVRRRKLWAGKAIHEPAAASAESVALISEEQRSVLAALRKLPARQREVLIFRFYLHEADDEIARLMGISPGTVRSTSHRALAALGKLLEENR